MRIVALVMTSFVSLCCWSDESEPELIELSLSELLDVKVQTVNRREQTVAEVPASVSIITSSDLELLGFNTLHNALEYVVGFSGVSGENNIWYGYSIRGDTVVNYNTKTLLMIDGIRIHNPLFGSFDLNSIPITAIDKIEIIKGARSVTYGSNAVNAVINIITKKEEPGQGEVIARVGEYETRYTAANWTHQIAEWIISGYAEEHTTDNQILVSNSEQAERVAYNKWLENHNLSLNATKDNLQLFGMIHRRLEPNFLTRTFTFVRETDVRGMLLGIKYDYEINESLNMNMLVSRYDWEAEREFFRVLTDADRTQLLTYNSYSKEVDRRIFYDSQLTEGIVEVDWSPAQTYRWKWGVAFSSSYGRRFQSRIDDFDIGQFKDKTEQRAIFSNAEWQATDSIRAFLGFRYDDYDYTFSGTGEDANFDNLSKEFSLVWSVDKQDSLKFIYGESFRVPTYFEKEANTPSTAGNTNLEPEYSESIDLIYYRQTDSFNLSLNLFYTKTEGAIGRGTAPDGRRQNQNLGESEIQGLETTLRWRLLENKLTGFGGIGVYDGTNMLSDGTEDSLRFTYDYMVTLGVDYRLTETLNLTSSLKHLSDWGDASSYSVVNLGLRCRCTNYSALSLTADIRNVLGEDVFKPEVSRVNPAVPFFPILEDPIAQIGVRYQF